MSYYDSIASGYNELHKEEQVKKLRIIASELSVGKTDLLLDVGCGTGFSIEFFPCKWIGLDPSFGLIKQCSGITVQGFGEMIPLKDQSVDYLISVTALHNYYDFMEGLSEMERVIRKKIVISVLKKSFKFDQIRDLIHEMFLVEREIDEGIDVIFVLEPKTI